MFQDRLSLFWIIGFRHYFGDPESFQNGSNIPFVIYLLSKNHVNAWFPCDTLLIEIVFPIPTKVSNPRRGFVQIESFKFLYRRYAYKVVPTYWLILTLDPYLWKRNESFLLELHRVLFTLTHNPTKWGLRVEQTMSSQEHLTIPMNGGCKNPQPITSFKPHVAFYHIVLNEVLP